MMDEAMLEEMCPKHPAVHVPCFECQFDADRIELEALAGKVFEQDSPMPSAAVRYIAHLLSMSYPASDHPVGIVLRKISRF